jgi:ELWxxDGT repeat protein
MARDGLGPHDGSHKEMHMKPVVSSTLPTASNDGCEPARNTPASFSSFLIEASDEEGVVTCFLRVLAATIFVLVAADARAANPRVSLVKDINPGTGDGALPYRGVVNGILYFQGSDGTHGPELWRSDGTAAGTYLVKDINPGPNGSAPVSFTDVNGTLFFAAVTAAAGYELWKSDGTAAGTVMTMDINPGTGSSIVSEPFTSLAVMNGVVYFQAYSPAYGFELWRSDGTEFGTDMVKDISSGQFPSLPGFPTRNQFLAVNGALFFTAYGQNNRL